MAAWAPDNRKEQTKSGEETPKGNLMVSAQPLAKGEGYTFLSYAMEVHSIEEAG
jgi:hypothetical protein